MLPTHTLPFTILNPHANCCEHASSTIWKFEVHLTLLVTHGNSKAHRGSTEPLPWASFRGSASSAPLTQGRFSLCSQLLLPLLWCPLHSLRRQPSLLVIPDCEGLEGALHLMWDLKHRERGVQITKPCSSVMRSIFRRVACAGKVRVA